MTEDARRSFRFLRVIRWPNPPFEKSHWSILPGLTEQLLHYLSYANQTLLQSISPVNIRGNDEAFPATEGWFFSVRASRRP